MTPNVAVVHIARPQHRGFHIWLPLFLLWIPLVLLSPIIFLVVVAVCIAGRVSMWRAIAAFWDLSCSLPGTHVHVRSDGNAVTVRIL
jgi:hypothetical protein